MKVIFDTSVVVSAVLKDRVPEETILFVLGNPDFTWIASKEIINEYVTVIKGGNSTSRKQPSKNGKAFSRDASKLKTYRLKWIFRATKKTPSFWLARYLKKRIT